MRSTQLEVILDSLLPKLYSFSYALVGDEEIAQQVIVDGYTVFIMNEKNFVAKIEAESEGIDRVQLKKYFYFEIIKAIYGHIKSREKSLIISSLDKFEHVDFYQMKLLHRAVLYLKEIENIEIGELQGLFSLQRHQVLELIHNAKYALSSNISHGMDQLESLQ